MKLLIVFLSILSFSLAEKLSLKNDFLDLNDIEFDIPEELATDFLALEKVFEKKVRSGTVAVINEFADKLLANIQNLFIQLSLDPMNLPDIHKNFSYKPLLITYHGEFDMDHGWLQGLSTIKRAADCEVSYSSSTKIGETLIPIMFDNLMFTYKYNAKIMGLGPSGDVDGKVENFNIKAALRFDFKEYKATLSQFQITNSGRIKIHFSGNILFDWMTNIFTDLVTFALHPIIVHIMESVIRAPLLALVDGINQLIESFLHSNTAAF